MPKFTDKLKHAWNAFKNEEERVESEPYFSPRIGPSYGVRPDRVRTMVVGDKSIIGSIYTRIGIDVSMVEIQHVKLDSEGRLESHINDSGLDYCLNVEANIDQAATAFRQDLVMTLFEHGTAAIVPVDTSLNPNKTGGYDIQTLRVGRIVQWFPSHVRVDLYNEKKGLREEVTLDKKFVAIVENPLYSVMNEPNSTLQRLIRKLSLLDAVDEQSSSGKLDMIIQLPYVIKSEARREQANRRRSDIEEQLRGSKYGIAYTDGTERITQLNRPAENNLWKQIQDLTEMLYSHLGLTPEVMNGTANEATMLNYHQRTIRPIMTAITEAMKRTFLTKTARRQGQSLEFYRDPFQLIPIGSIAEIGDKFTRNEIMTANELRSAIGLRPSKEAKADQLQNSNMPVDKRSPDTEESEDSEETEDSMAQSALDQMNDELSAILTDLGEDPDDG